MKNLFFFAGEASGDLHGAALISALKQQLPHLHCWGVGGPAMRDLGIQGPQMMEDFQVMGFSDVIRAFPRLYRQFHHVKNTILTGHPDGVILIDYPGFNLRLAKALRKKGYKGQIVQYISPTVWAHGRGRIQTLVDHVDLLLTIYPFEKAYYPPSLKVEYTGNPLVETIKAHHYEALKEIKGDNLIALFPGSRIGEIKRNLPVMLGAIQKLQKEDRTLHIGLSVGHPHLRDTIENIIQQYPIENVQLIPAKYKYELMKSCTKALAKSGTVTLELAFHGVPTVVIYALTRLNYYVAKYLLRLRLPHYCIVNILADRELFPEIIGTHISADSVAKALSKLGEREDMREPLSHLKEHLGSQNTHQESAKAIIELLKN